MKIQTMGSLISEMRAVARNEGPAPADAATPSAESRRGGDPSADPREPRPAPHHPRRQAPIGRRTGTPDRTRRTEPVADPRQARSLWTAGMRMVERRRVPTVLVRKLHVEIDPYVMADKIENECGERLIDSVDQARRRNVGYRPESFDPSPRPKSFDPSPPSVGLPGDRGTGHSAQRASDGSPPSQPST